MKRLTQLRLGLGLQLGLFLLFSALSFGQRQDTIYQNLATVSSTALPLLLGPTTNIGQSAHQAVLKIEQKGGAGTCKAGDNTHSPTITLQGSYVPQSSVDNTSRLASKGFVNFGTLPFFITVQAEGAYPYIYVYVNGIDLTNCTYTVDYSGSLYPFPRAIASPSVLYNFWASEKGIGVLLDRFAATPFTTSGSASGVPVAC